MPPPAEPYRPRTKEKGNMTEENKNMEWIVSIEGMMPRDWLTPDLRMMCAEQICSWIQTEPWNLNVDVKDN